MLHRTKDILFYHAIGRNIDERWVAWAVDQLVAGLDSPSLCILAGESPPFDQKELSKLVDQVFVELELTWSSDETYIKAYVKGLLEEMLAGDIEIVKTLEWIMGFCAELGYAAYLYNFYLLYHAQDMLQTFDVQSYWPGADRSNIDNVIVKYAREWIEKVEGESR